MLIWSQIKNQAGTQVDRVDSAYITKIDAWGNQIYNNIYDRRPWMAALRPFQVSCVAGQGYVILPQEIAQVIDVSQTETPIILALRRYYNRLRRSISTTPNQGSPIELNPMGTIGIKAALPSGGTITVESDESTDTTQKIRVRGFDSTTKLPITELITLNGTSAVTSAESYSASEGYEPSFSKDSTTSGTITIKRSSTTIAEISPRDMTVRYMKWLAYPTPTQNTTLYITGKVRQFKLEYDEDVPVLDCENAIIAGIVMMALQKKRMYAKASEKEKQFENLVAILEAKEPKYDENFEDVWYPKISRESIDQQFY